MNVDELETLIDDAEHRVNNWLTDAVKSWVLPEMQRQALTAYLELSDSAKKLLSAEHRREMEDLRRRWS